MNVKYPVEALALSMILFSTNMKEAFIAGAFILVAVTWAMFLRNWLMDCIPDWSIIACVSISAAVVCACSFQAGDYFLKLDFTWRTYLIAIAAGLLAGKHVLQEEATEHYGELFYEMAIGWGVFLILSAVREFLSFGSIAGNHLADPVFAAKTFQKTMFGYLTAGMGIAFTNGILKKTVAKADAMLAAFAVAIVFPPISLKSYPEAATAVAGIFVVLVCLYSIQKRIAYSDTGKAFRKLPVELLSLGFLYMILSVF